MPSRCEALDTEGATAQGPHEAIYARGINDDRLCTMFAGNGRRDHGDCLLMAFDGLKNASLM